MTGLHGSSEKICEICRQKVKKLISRCTPIYANILKFNKYFVYKTLKAIALG